MKARIGEVLVPEKQVRHDLSEDETFATAPLRSYWRIDASNSPRGGSKYFPRADMVISTWIFFQPSLSFVASLLQTVFPLTPWPSASSSSEGS